MAYLSITGYSTYLGQDNRKLPKNYHVGSHLNFQEAVPVLLDPVFF
jgi:hypothetical protein